MSRFGFYSALVVASMTVNTAQAAVITIYTNQTSFIAATPGGFDPTGMSTIKTGAAANAAINASDTIYGASDGVWVASGSDNVDFSFEHVTFSARPTIPASIHIFQNSTSLIAGMDYNIYNGSNENHNIYFHGDGALAFGFKGLDSTSTGVCQVTCGNSSFNITIYNGATSFGTYNFNPPFSNASVGYFGIVSDTPFTRIQVIESTAHFEPYDNEVFGEYRLLMAPSESVPAPASGLALVIGLAGLGTLMARRQWSPRPARR